MGLTRAYWVALAPLALALMAYRITSVELKNGGTGNRASAIEPFLDPESVPRIVARVALPRHPLAPKTLDDKVSKLKDLKWQGSGTLRLHVAVTWLFRRLKLVE